MDSLSTEELLDLIEVLKHEIDGKGKCLEDEALLMLQEQIKQAILRCTSREELEVIRVATIGKKGILRVLIKVISLSIKNEQTA